MRIAALVEAVDHVCCRYRVAGFLPFFERAGHRLEMIGIPRSPFARLRLFRSLAAYDLIILQRKLFSRVELAVLRRYSRRLVFDFDDAVWLRDSFAAKGPHDARRLARFRAICRSADAVTPGNRFLMQQAMSHLPKLICFRVPTCVDEARYPTKLPAKIDEKIRLGWIGSSSTLQGLRSISTILDRLADISPNLVLRIICDQPLKLDRLPTEFRPWSADTEVRDLAECDIGISWIPDDDWSRGKCGLKTLQYMAAGLPVMANPVGVHPEMIVQGTNGLLAESTQEWVKGVKSLVEDGAFRLSLGAAARRTVEKEYSVQAGADRWLELIDKLAPARMSA